ncbi:hypothetical protein NBRC116188_21490 [Oceaniserpentilla sp. 4NH20-0058]|uniref:hypothetical protein n=1 Tax=Oceaniserpentilla sp. 4NH20-0058 TaxID=3127660 RepID=UPI00310267C4
MFKSALFICMAVFLVACGKEETLDKVQSSMQAVESATEDAVESLKQGTENTIDRGEAFIDSAKEAIDEAKADLNKTVPKVKEAMATGTMEG